MGFSKLLQNEDPEESLKLLNRMREREDKVMNEKIMRMQECWYSSLSRRDLDTKTWNHLKIDSEELEKAAQYVRAWNPDCDYGLFLFGKPGNGKTHMIKALIIDHFSSSRQFLFKSVSDVMAAFKDFEYKEFHHETLNKPYGLILDDLGTEKASEFEQNELFRLIENRIHSKKPVFITSNLDMAQLKEKYSERIISRLGEMMAFIKNEAPSHRTKIFYKNRKHLTDQMEMKKLAQQDTSNLIRGSFGE